MKRILTISLIFIPLSGCQYLQAVLGGKIAYTSNFAKHTEHLMLNPSQESLQRLLRKLITNHVDYSESTERYLAKLALERPKILKKLSQFPIQIIKIWVHQFEHTSITNSNHLKTLIAGNKNLWEHILYLTELQANVLALLPENIVIQRIKRLNISKSHHDVYGKALIFYKNASKKRISEIQNFDDEEKMIFWTLRPMQELKSNFNYRDNISEVIHFLQNHQKTESNIFEDMAPLDFDREIEGAIQALQNVEQ